MLVEGMDTEGAGVGAPAEALGEGLGDGEGAEGLGGGEGGDGGEGGGEGGDGGEGGAGEPDTRTPVVQVASHFYGGRVGAAMVSLAGWLLVAGAVHTPALCAPPAHRDLDGGARLHQAGVGELRVEADELGSGGAKLDGDAGKGVALEHGVQPAEGDSLGGEPGYLAGAAGLGVEGRDVDLYREGAGAQTQWAWCFASPAAQWQGRLAIHLAVVLQARAGTAPAHPPAGRG